MRAGWAIVPLGEVMRPALDPHRVDASRSYPNLGIYSFGRGVFQKPPIEGTNTSASTLYRVRAGQFIYSRLFAFEGAYGLVPRECDGYYVSNEFPTFDCDPERLDSSFVSWLFKRPTLWRDIAARSTGMGDRRQRIHPEQVLAEAVPLPPLEEQRRIVARIDALAAKIAEARRLREGAANEVDALKAARTSTLFSDGLIGHLPQVALGEVAEIRAGVTLGRQVVGDVVRLPYLRVANVQDGHLRLDELKEVEIYASEVDKWALSCGDLLLTEGGDWDKLGRGTVWQGEVTDCIHQNHIFRVRLDQRRLDPWYVAALVASPRGKTYFQAASKQTTNLASINQRQLKAFPVPVPDLGEQRRIVAELDALQVKVDAVKRLQAETAAELNALLPAILDRAFKGEL